MFDGLMQWFLNRTRVMLIKRDGYVPVNKKTYLAEIGEFRPESNYELIVQCLGERLFADGGLDALKLHADHLFWLIVTARIHLGEAFAEPQMQFAQAVRKGDLEAARKLAAAPISYAGAALEAVKLRIGHNPPWYEAQARETKKAYVKFYEEHINDPEFTVDKAKMRIWVKAASL
ncbi:hypothetical protein F9L33_02815 [Amylibacter sp. SFDW26]|uniref:hypothetical protein n=1 Tax=Amylibacter sp. SFDW26 TaxID=2652722 RepID=UPI001261AE5E|nr:hypothetical protein [Amylibacter sp. SFDW26]KAB7615711.1 hypothetical protein F9L33_02815 [Amylibacter sp. SFDW26]